MLQKRQNRHCDIFWTDHRDLQGIRLFPRIYLAALQCNNSGMKLPLSSLGGDFATQKPEETHIRIQVCSSKNCTSLIIVFFFRTSKARQPLLGDTRAWECEICIREVSHIVQLLFSSFQTGSATIEELMLGGTRTRRHHGQTVDLHLGKYFNWTSGTCS